MIEVAPRSSHPRLPEGVVRRNRLDLTLTSSSHQIVLVSAPAGAGKTTMIACGLADGGTWGTVVWRSLEHRPGLPDSVAETVVDALREIGVAGPRAGAAGEDIAALRVALREIEDGNRLVTVVLDDAQEVTSLAELATLSYLLEHAPAQLRVIVLSRADLPIRTSRLRVAGRVLELRSADLRFEVHEAQSLFDAHGVRVTASDARALHALTEGWAAGLRLIACAVASGADPHELARGSQVEASVAEYLMTEVLARQSDDVQRFLERTSVVDRLTPDIAALLSGEPDAASRLDSLERQGVFLESDPLGGYRYHSLFASLLRAKLRYDDPELFRDLHTRAARWFAANQAQAVANDHARTAGDWQLLGRLMRDEWLDGLVAGREPPMAITGAVPERAVRTVPDLAVVSSAAACARGDREAAEHFASSVPTVVPEGSRRTNDAAAPAMLAILRGRAFGAQDPSFEASQALRSDLEIDPRLRRLAILLTGELHLDHGDLDALRRELSELDDADPSWMSTTAHALIALSNALDGRLRVAEVPAAAIADGDGTGDHAAAVAIAQLAMALVHAQRGRMDWARDAARAASTPTSSRPLRVIERAVRAVLAGGRTVMLDASSAHHPAAGRALVALGALDVVDASGSPVRPGGVAESALRSARHATGVANGAVLASVRALPPTGDAHPRTIVELQTLAAIAASGDGDPFLASFHLTAALREASGEELWAPMLEHGARLMAPLQVLASSGTSYQHDVLALLDVIRPTEGPAASPELTQQELVVLHFLATMRSNAEIAAAMHISINTVKTHLQSIYRKLGVDRRRDAVVRARQLELLT